MPDFFDADSDPRLKLEARADPSYLDTLDKPLTGRLTSYRVPYGEQEGTFDGGLGADIWVGYNDGHTENAYRWTDYSPWIEAIQLTDLELTGVRDHCITEIKVSCGDDNYGFAVSPYNIYIETSLGDLSTYTPVASGTTSGTGWDIIPIPEYPIPNTGDVFVMVEFYNYPTTAYPAGTDIDNSNPKGDWMLNIGSTTDWVHLPDIGGGPYVWGLDAHIEPCSGGGPVGDCIEDACDFAIMGPNNPLMYNGKINELPKVINISYTNLGELGINEVKLLADVYKKICGPTTDLYCDDKYPPWCTEEPCHDPYDFPIWHNWSIYDDDPDEIHGNGDTWVMQGGPDNRWFTNEQAWRNTKGEDRTYGFDEDTYLGLSQNAVGFDNLSFVPIDPKWNDVSGAACATVTFMHWAEGEYTFDEDGNVIPIDYGYISWRLNDGTYMHDPMNTCNNVEDSAGWNKISLADFLAYDTGGEWQEVTIKFLNENVYDASHHGDDYKYYDICDDCDPDENDIVVHTPFPDTALLEIRFSWVKDPCQQYEGWYIDQFCISRTETYELELIHQTHWILVNIPGCDPEVGPVWKFFDFPLGWDPEPDTWYYIEICAQVFDPNDCEYDTDNNCVDLEFYVTDIHDLICKDMEVLTDPPYYEGESIAVNVTVMNIGTFGEDDAEVALRMADCVIAPDGIDDEFESDPSGRWACYYFIGADPACYWDWTQGDPSISKIWEIDEPAARSVLPGRESMLGGNHGSEVTYPYLTEGIATMITNDVVYDFVADDAEGAELSFYAKWSLEIEQYYDSWYGTWNIVPGSEGAIAPILVHPVAGPSSAYWWFVDFGTLSHGGQYYNDWVKVEIDMLQLQMDFGYVDTLSGETLYPGIEFGWGLFTDDWIAPFDGDCSNPTNPIPWSGIMLDRIQLKETICQTGGTEVGTIPVPYLAPGDEVTVTGTFADVPYCNHCLIADVNLDGDIDTTNDICKTCVRVTNVTDIGEWSTIDLTGSDPECPTICCSRDGGNDDCYVCFAVEDPTWGHYENNWDVSMISPTINISIADTYGAWLNFSHWFHIIGGDCAEVYIRPNSATPWMRLDKFTGYNDDHPFWSDKTYFIAPEYCTETFQVKFRFYSNAEDFAEGYCFDDVAIIMQDGSSFGPEIGTISRYMVYIQ
jgi:hypothetical protein